MRAEACGMKIRGSEDDRGRARRPALLLDSAQLPGHMQWG